MTTLLAVENWIGVAWIERSEIRGIAVSETLLVTITRISLRSIQATSPFLKNEPALDALRVMSTATD